jgi:hypothetical protein
MLHSRARFLLPLILAAMVATSSAATNLTGNIKTLAGSPSTSRITFSYKIQNCTTDPVANGAALDTTQYSLSPNDSGSISVTLYRTDTEISCGGVNTSYYTFYIYAGAKVVWQKNAYLTATTADLATLPSINPVPPPIAGNYAIRNGNNAFTGIQDFSNATVTGIAGVGGTPGAAISGSPTPGDCAYWVTGTAISSTPCKQKPRRFYPAESCDGSRTTFTFGAIPVNYEFQFFWNGLEQNEADDFTVSGTTLTLLRACKTGDKLWAFF